METTWKAIPGFAGYEASTSGEIRNAKTKRIIKTEAQRKNYRFINIADCMQPVHRLVALTFVPAVEGKRYVNHKNNDKRDNRAENLEWVTNSENVKQAVAEGRAERTYMQNHVRVTYPDAEPIIYESTTAAEDALGLWKGAVNYYVNNTDGKVGDKYVLEYFMPKDDHVEEREITLEGFTHLLARSDGTIINKQFQRPVTGSFDGKYRRIKSLGSGKTSKGIHYLIALAFVPNPENKPDVYHLDGNQENNVPSNLAWTTKKESMTRAHVTGAISKEAVAKIIEKVSVPVCMLNDDFSIIKTYPSVKAASEDNVHLGAHPQTITKVCKLFKEGKRHHRTGGFHWAYPEDIT